MSKRQGFVKTLHSFEKTKCEGVLLLSLPSPTEDADVIGSEVTACCQCVCICAVLCTSIWCRLNHVRVECPVGSWVPIHWDKLASSMLTVSQNVQLFVCVYYLY